MSDGHEYVRRPFPVDHEANARRLRGRGEKLRYLVLPPEMSDGSSKWAVDLDQIGSGVIDELLKTWQDEATEGETIEIGFVQMTEDEFKALPEM